MKNKLIGQKLISLIMCTAFAVQFSACKAPADEGAVQTPEVYRPGIFGSAGEISAFDNVNSNYDLTIDAGEPVHEISDTLFGIFIEDINFAADGGLYAEMIQNRSFEFTQLAAGNELHAWSEKEKSVFLL